MLNRRRLGLLSPCSVRRLSYVKFHCLDTTRTIHDGDLKNLLAEVLLDMRTAGRCLVKFERKTGCFHITAIK